MATVVDAGKLLVVDGDLASRAMLSTRLASNGYDVQVAEAAAEAIEKIRKERFDLVVLDPSSHSGIDLLALLRATFSPNELPVILVTDRDGSGTAEQVRAADGPNDSTTKPGEFRATSARIETQLLLALAERQARYRDPLTGLDSRSLLMKKLEEALDSARSDSAPALLVVNLDGFKVLNASFGQRAGDQLLSSAASRLKSEFLEDAHVARIGGDEFAVLSAGSASNGRSPEEANELATRAARCFREPFALGETSLTVTASIGAAMCQEHGSTADELWREADHAMRRAKERGKNRFELFDPTWRQHAQTRAKIGTDLRHALERRELVAFYQPQIDLKSRIVTGFEALLRWRHPSRGLVPPAEFIPVAEDLGLIIPIGEWILHEACHQLKAWQQDPLCGRRLTMNVNLSAKQLYDPLMIHHVAEILHQTGIDPSTLKLELTESTLMTEITSARTTLAQLRALGVGLELDDFGTGYSSLNYLHTLQFDSLKIDRSFTCKVNRDPETEAIVAAIINLAHTLRMRVIAEGIETPEQFQLLDRMNCDTGQGYYFSKPIPPDQAERFLCGHLGVDVAFCQMCGDDAADHPHGPVA